MSFSDAPSAATRFKYSYLAMRTDLDRGASNLPSMEVHMYDLSDGSNNFVLVKEI